MMTYKGLLREIAPLSGMVRMSCANGPPWVCGSLFRSCSSISRKLSCHRLARWSVTLAARRNAPRSSHVAFLRLPARCIRQRAGRRGLVERKRNRRGEIVLAASVRLHRASRWHPFKMSPLRNKTGLTVRSDSIQMTAILRTPDWPLRPDGATRRPIRLESLAPPSDNARTSRS